MKLFLVPPGGRKLNPNNGVDEISGVDMLAHVRLMLRMHGLIWWDIWCKIAPEVCEQFSYPRTRAFSKLTLVGQCVRGLTGALRMGASATKFYTLAVMQAWSLGRMREIVIFSQSLSLMFLCRVCWNSWHRIMYYIELYIYIYLLYFHSIFIHHLSKKRSTKSIVVLS